MTTTTTTSTSNAANVVKAAQAIANATHVLFTAGAGMGVDSGIPDFRGPEGFWKAYPAFKGRKFEEMSNPTWFKKDPLTGWGFFGHRYHVYSSKQPHEGYHILHKIANKLESKTPNAYYVFTSNVDGHFAKVFPTERITECHGSIHYLQCTMHKQCGIWPVPEENAFRAQLDVDMEQVKLKSEDLLPKCKCGLVSRPNIMMFGDGYFSYGRLAKQETAQEDWEEQIPDKSKLVVIEIGAGKAVPTVRFFSESSAADKQGHLIRINLRDSDGPDTTDMKTGKFIPIALGAKDALQQIEQELFNLKFF